MVACPGDAATIGAPGTPVNRKSRFAASPALARALAALALALTAGAPHPTAQSRAPLTEERARALARQASREAKGDATELVLALDRLVRQEHGDFESFPLSIVRRQELLVTLTAPYVAFRRSLVDLLRTGRPADGARWTGAMVVTVEPLRLDAPDIESVQVSRGGRIVPPVSDRLRPMTFSNGSGEQRAVHAGDVHFPVATFAPGAQVVLTLASKGSDPIAYTFSDDELRLLR